MPIPATQIAFCIYLYNRFMFQVNEWSELGSRDIDGQACAGSRRMRGAEFVNLFRYCGDDPVDRSDPTGLIDRNSKLTSLGGGDWNWWAGRVAGEMLAEQKLWRIISSVLDAAGVDVPYTGNNIRWTERGNFRDGDISHHLSSEKKYDQNGNRLPGWTDKPTIGVHLELAGGKVTGNITAVFSLSTWISKALSLTDQRRVWAKEQDHPRDWGDWLNGIKDQAYLRVAPTQGRPVTGAVSQLRSFLGDSSNAEFDRQIQYYDFGGKHNVPVTFLDEK